MTQHYFPNGSEGEAWMNRWCYRCRNDHDYHGGGDEQNSCVHMCNLFIHEHDPVFLAGDREWVCIEFTRCPCDGGPDDPGEPIPPPPDPNQLALFDGDSVPAGVPADVWHDTFERQPA